MCIRDSTNKHDYAARERDRQTETETETETHRERDCLWKSGNTIAEGRDSSLGLFFRESLFFSFRLAVWLKSRTADDL